MVYGASKRISTSFGSVATSEDGILYSSAIDFWSSFSPFDDDEEEALAERKHLFVLVVVLLLRLLGDEVVASEDESVRSDVAVDMTRKWSFMWSLAFGKKISNKFVKCISNPLAYSTTTTLVSRARISSSLDD